MSSIVAERGRGIEHEYAVTSQPPDAQSRRRIVDLVVAEHERAGWMTRTPWVVDDESGNRQYEKHRRSIWSLEEGPFEQARNGSRIYDDHMHAEIASPVYRRPSTGLVYQRVADCMMRRATERVAGQLGTVVHAYRNNVSTTRESDTWTSVSFGTHLNTSVSRSALDQSRWARAQRALVPYVVTRVPLVGAGDMVPTTAGRLDLRGGRLSGDDLQFAVSPRACFIRHVSHVDTTVDRGLLNERDEPHASPTAIWRLHDINVEAVRCDVQTFLVDGLESLVLAAFERGLLDDSPQLRDPVGTAARLSLSGATFDWSVTLADGRSADALRDILMGHYLARVSDLVDREGDAEDRAIVDALVRVVEAIMARDIDGLTWVIDWITKLALIEEYGVARDDALLLCNQYALLDAGTEAYLGATPDEGDSLFEPAPSLAAAGSWLSGVDARALPAAAAVAMTEPPRESRDYARIDLLTRDPDRWSGVSWSRLHAGEATLEFRDPLEPSADRWPRYRDLALPELQHALDAER